jgi:hypothetical protein
MQEAALSNAVPAAAPDLVGRLWVPPNALIRRSFGFLPLILELARSRVAFRPVLFAFDLEVRAVSYGAFASIIAMGFVGRHLLAPY